MAQTGISFLYKEQTAVVIRVEDLVVFQINRENMNGTISQVWIKLDSEQVNNLISFLNEGK